MFTHGETLQQLLCDPQSLTVTEPSQSNKGQGHSDVVAKFELLVGIKIYYKKTIQLEPGS
jgi:hypothetical protein